MTGQRSDGAAPSLSEEDMMELLPWYATGKTSAAETRAIEGALARSPKLQAELALVRREREVAHQEAATIGDPSPALLQKLMRDIEGARQLPALQRDAPEGAAAGFLRRWLGLSASPALRVALVAACLVIVVEGAAILRLAGSGTTAYQTASAPDTTAAGPHLIVTFKPEAGIGAIGDLVSGLDASVIRGPMPGGAYVIALKPGTDIDQAIAALRGHADLVATVDQGS